MREKSLEETINRYEVDLENIRKQRKEIIREAKEEALHILSESNAKIENTIREIRNAQAEKEQTRLARKALSEYKESVASVEEEQTKISREIEKIQKRKAKKQHNKSVRPVPEEEEIRVGDSVRLKGQTSAGTVLEVDDKQATVAFGMIKSTVKLERLEKVSRNQIKKEMQKSSYISAQTLDRMSEKKLNFKQEIDVRGMRGDEALQSVTYFIDDAIQVGVSPVRILHGTGSGILRQLIREYLKSVPGVRNFHDEHVQFGGAGITVVELE